LLKSQLANEFTTKPTSFYVNFQVLAPQFKIYWNVSGDKIIFELHVKTNGWIGFGLSPNGHMDQSDIMVGWIANGETFLTVGLDLYSFLYQAFLYNSDI
jgi:hypothetical protein